MSHSQSTDARGQDPVATEFLIDAQTRYRVVAPSLERALSAFRNASDMSFEQLVSAFRDGNELDVDIFVERFSDVRPAEAWRW